MGRFEVDGTSTPGLLKLTLKGTFTREEMLAFVRAHNAAIDAFAGEDYRVWCDVRELTPLTQDAAELMEEAKRHSASQPGFQGSAVYVSSATIALQHKRTSVSGGVMETELISDDEATLLAHLATVKRAR